VEPVLLMLMIGLTAFRRELFGTVAIDLLAGPSEVAQQRSPPPGTTTPHPIEAFHDRPKAFPTGYQIAPHYRACATTKSTPPA
jgi:hypothetical protein